MAPDDHIEGAVIDRTVYLKPIGFATQRNSLAVPDFVHAMFRAGCNCVAFDLSECKGVDSTFLGVIAEAATASPRRPGKTVVILNAGQALIRQLRRTGLLPLICVHAGQAEPPQGIELRPLDVFTVPKSESQRLQSVKRLHEKLVQLNERNERLFGPFLEMLEEELQGGDGASAQQ